MLVAGIFAFLFIGLLSGHPIAFFFGAFGLFLGLLFWGPQSTHIIVGSIFKIMNNWLLVAIPLFVFMSTVLQRSGLAEKLFTSLHRLFGKFRGGLAIVIILISMLLGACTGIIAATLLTMGLIGVPNLIKQGYRRDFSYGLVMAGGCLSTIIPPSIMLVVMGQVTNLSVGKLFMAALFPGLLLSSLYIFYIILKSLLQPASVGKGSIADFKTTEPISSVRLISIVTSILPPVLLIAAVLGSIYTGVATPTEAAAIGAFSAIIMSIGYKKFNLKMLLRCCFYYSYDSINNSWCDRFYYCIHGYRWSSNGTKIHVISWPGEMGSIFDNGFNYLYFGYVYGLDCDCFDYISYFHTNC